MPHANARDPCSSVANSQPWELCRVPPPLLDAPQALPGSLRALPHDSPSEAVPLFQRPAPVAFQQSTHSAQKPLAKARDRCPSVACSPAWPLCRVPPPLLDAPQALPGSLWSSPHDSPPESPSLCERPLPAAFQQSTHSAQMPHGKARDRCSSGRSSPPWVSCRVPPPLLDVPQALPGSRYSPPRGSPSESPSQCERPLPVAIHLSSHPAP